MPVKAHQYQKDGVRMMEAFLTSGGGTLLADDMGLGKTLQTLWLLKRNEQMLPALVVCPVNVKYTWEHWAQETLHTHAQVFEGRTPPIGRIGIVPKIMIINPDILISWLNYFRKISIRTLILDECQYYIDPSSQRTKAAITLARQTPYRMALSGTPLTNRPAELWPTLHMLQPDTWPSFFTFGQEYCNPKKEFGRWTYKGAKNLPKLHGILKETCMVRRLMEDVRHELPKKVRQIIPMGLANRNEYDEARDDFLGWLKKTYDKATTSRAARAAAVTRVGYLLRLAAKLKARAVVDWANAFLTERPDEKLILIATHHKMIDVLQRRVHAKHVTIDGSVSGRRRALAVSQFSKDKDTRLLIGNIKAVGTGTDGLQNSCHNLAFTELWWVPGTHTQTEGRIYRIGQHKVSWVWYLVAFGTIEEALCQIIQDKQKIIHATLDGEDYQSDMDVWDQLLEALEKESK